MITTHQAYQLILDKIPAPALESVSIDACLNRTLFNPIYSDRHYPPFDRACMDGYAISDEAWQQGLRTFTVEASVRAGDPQVSLKDPYACIEIMTGAPTPLGCQIVIRIEDTERTGDKVLITADSLRQGQNIHPCGFDYHKEDQLISAGTTITSPEMAILASVGQTQIPVIRRPKTAIISTGDELVEIHAQPAIHQIRRSNPYQLQAAWSQHNLGEADLFHFNDHLEILQEGLKKVISHYDVVILSGGVSMGKYDFIPQVLKDLQVEEHFHKIAQKPGKPMWFGSHTNGTLVFGLPGNPVSAAVCLSRYVIPAFKSKLFQLTHSFEGFLTQDLKGLNSLANFIPVALSYDNGQVILKPEPTKGSGDFASLTRSTGFVEISAQALEKAHTHPVRYFPW